MMRRRCQPSLQIPRKVKSIQTFLDGCADVLLIAGCLPLFSCSILFLLLLQEEVVAEESCYFSLAQIVMQIPVYLLLDRERCDICSHTSMIMMKTESLPSGRWRPHKHFPMNMRISSQLLVVLLCCCLRQEDIIKGCSCISFRKILTLQSHLDCVIDTSYIPMPLIYQSRCEAVLGYYAEVLPMADWHLHEKFPVLIMALVG